MRMIYPLHTSGTSVTKITEDINRYTNAVIAYLEEKGVDCCSRKIKVTFFTPDTKEVDIHPTIKFKGERVKLDKTPKSLGLTFDTMLPFSHHINPHKLLIQNYARNPK